MSKLSNKAFAIMAVCEKTKEHFGITVDPRNGCYAFTWAFKIKKEQAKKEGYEQTHVTGKVMYDKDFNGCPYCGSKKFYICNFITRRNFKKIISYYPGHWQISLSPFLEYPAVWPNFANLLQY